MDNIQGRYLRAGINVADGTVKEEEANLFLLNHCTHKNSH